MWTIGWDALGNAPAFASIAIHRIPLETSMFPVINDRPLLGYGLYFSTVWREGVTLTNKCSPHHIYCPFVNGLHPASNEPVWIKAEPVFFENTPADDITQR